VPELVRTCVEALAVVLKSQVNSVRQIAVTTRGVGTVRVNVRIQGLQDRSLNG
jgi:hypothetical protein